MKINQDHLTQIAELETANLALEEEIQALKLTQATLKETENKFRAMVELATEGIVVTQDLQKVYYNPAWIKLIGYSAEEYESLSLLSLIHPDDLELAKETYFHLTDELYEFRIIVKSGDTKWIATRTSRIDWEGKPAELFIAEDITERKKTEQALAKSEAHLQKAQEIAHAGSWDQDLINGELIWSDETYRIFGIPSKTPLDYETFLNCILPEDRDYVIKKRQAALAGAPYDIEFRICVGGVVKWVREKAEITFDQADRATRTIGVIIDISERKKIEQALQASEQNLREAQAIAHVGHWEWDIPNDKIYWSDEVYRIYGLDPGTELNYDTLMATIHPDDRDNHNEMTAAWIKNRGGDPYEYRIIRPDGSIRYVNGAGRVECDKAGEPTRFIGTVQDITSLKLTEINLRESEARFRATFEQAAVGIAHVALDGGFLRVNQKFCEIVGYDLDEMLKLTFQDITHPDDLDADLAYVRKLLAGQIPTYSMEKRYFKKGGNITWINLTGSLVHTLTGDPDYFIAVVDEITERKVVQQALRESERKYRTLFTEMKSGCTLQEIVLNEQGIPVDYITLDINPAAEKLLSVRKKDVLGLPINSLLPPDEFHKWLTFFGQVALTGESAIFEQYTPFNDKYFQGNVYCPTQGQFAVIFDDVTERKQTDEELRLHSALINAVGEAVIATDMQGEIIFWNQAAERIYGWERDEVLGKDVIEVTPTEESSTSAAEIVESLKQGNFWSGEFWVRHKDGHKFLAQVTDTILEDEYGNPKAIIGVSEDITEPKRTEEELQASEQRFAALFENAAMGIDLVDTAGHLIVHNPAVERFLGYSNEELRGRTFHEFSHPEDIDIDVALFNELIANLRDYYQIEKQFITKDGRTVWGRLTVSVVRKKGGEPRFLIRMIEDITSRKRVEQALNESELKYRTVVEQATEGIMVVQDYERKYYNAAFREMTGYSEEDYESNPFMTIIHPEDIGAIEEVYQALVSQQAEDAYSEFRIYTKSGDIKWLSIHGTSIEWEGRPAGMVIANDITERKHWEEQIQSYQRQLKALASQLTLTEEQERRRIAAELHDQVGQSLAFSRMQIAAAKSAKSDDQREALLDETSETLKETIQDTRSLVFDLSSPLLNELGLNAAISEWMEEHLEKQAGLEAELIEIGSEQHLSADMRAIVFRSVRELLNNVIRHARATCVRVTVEQTSTQVRITVQDDGVGFQPEKIVPGLTRADGFGLFSIQERMSDLGGSFTIQSAPGEGTQITLCLPNQVS